MSMVPGQLEFVIGVDTHKSRHTVSVVDHLGGLIASTSVAVRATRSAGSWSGWGSRHQEAGSGLWRGGGDTGLALLASRGIGAGGSTRPTAPSGRPRRRG